MLRLLQNGRRISQYLRSKAPRAPGNSAASRMRARASTSGPVMRPRPVQGATSTRGLLRILLYFHESSRVITYSLPFSSANHSGVRTACPFLRKLATLMYLYPATFVNRLGTVPPLIAGTMEISAPERRGVASPPV